MDRRLQIYHDVVQQHFTWFGVSAHHTGPHRLHQKEVHQPKLHRNSHYRHPLRYLHYVASVYNVLLFKYLITFYRVWIFESLKSNLKSKFLLTILSFFFRIQGIGEHWWWGLPNGICNQRTNSGTGNYRYRGRYGGQPRRRHFLS